jgi:hypothetical protein
METTEISKEKNKIEELIILLEDLEFRNVGLIKVLERLADQQQLIDNYKNIIDFYPKVRN